MDSNKDRNLMKKFKNSEKNESLHEKFDNLSKEHKYRSDTKSKNTDSLKDLKEKKSCYGVKKFNENFSRKFKNMFKNSKIRLLLILLIIILIVQYILFSNGIINPIKYNYNIGLNKTTLYLHEETNVQKTFNDLLPRYAADPNVIIKISNPSILKINGLTATAIGIGETNVDFYIGNKIIKTQQVTVKEDEVKDLDVDFSSNLEYVGDKCYLNLNVITDNSSESGVIPEVSSSNSAVIQVINNDELVANGIGRCEISIKAGNLTKVFRYEIKEKENEEKYYNDVNKELDEDMLGKGPYYYNEQPHDYIIPDSDNRYIDESELRERSDFDLAIARNEIFARHGYIFTEEPYKTYFSSKSWYHENPNFKGDDSEINDYEKQNSITILNEEKNRRNIR